MRRKINNVTTEAVAKATGRSWDDWIGYIDGHGGADLDHKGIVKLLRTKAKLASGWWQQMVTVGYEHAKGRRKTGETADAGFQVGVQKTIPLGRSALWKLLTTGRGRQLWLGQSKELAFEPGESFATREGVTGEVRSRKRGHRLRVTWQPPKRRTPTTLQWTLSCPRNTRGKTTLRFHHEKLGSKAERERMRAHWRRVLNEILALASREA